LNAEELYLRFSLPLGLLYGPTLAILFKRLKGKKQVIADGLHFVPFFIGIFICFVIVLNANFRYAYSYISGIALCFFSLIQLSSYLILIKREMVKMQIHAIKEPVSLQITWYFVMTTLVAAQLFLINSAIVGSDSLAVYHSFSSLLCVLFFVGMLFLFSSYSRTKAIAKIVVDVQNGFTINHRNLVGIKKSMVKKSQLVTYPITVLQEVEYREKIEHFIQTLKP